MGVYLDWQSTWREKDPRGEFKSTSITRHRVVVGEMSTEISPRVPMYPGHMTVFVEHGKQVEL